MPGFRQRNARALYEMHFGPNMTPMVDVTMVLLIFFMASVSLLGPELLLRTALPEQPQQARQAQDADQPDDVNAPRFSAEPPTFTLRLRVAPDERAPATNNGANGVPNDAVIAVDGLGLAGATLAELRDATARVAQDLRAAGAVDASDEITTLLVIEASGDVPYDAVVRAQDICRQAGFTRIGLR